MKTKFRIQTAGFALLGVLGFAGTPALADSISPDTFTATLGVGESVTINKTVTVDEGTLTTGLVDVFFLVDTSGSMGGVINAVKNNATSILSGTSGFGDVAWGVGSYEDFPTSPWGSASDGDEQWRLNQAITTDQTAVQAGIDALTRRSGADGPESNLEALYQTASNETVGWRDGSKRFIVWFGDARGHDPISCVDQGIAGCTNPATADYPGATLTQTIAALDEEAIEVIGVNRLAGTTGSGIDSTGQATAIINAVGGDLLSLAGNPAGAIVDTIQDALEAAFAEYGMVSLMPVGNLPGVGVSVSSPFIGEFDRSETRTFDFEVMFTGLEAGVYDFTIGAMVDGVRVATEFDRITVTGDVTAVPEPGTMALLLAGFGAIALFMRRRFNAV